MNTLSPYLTEVYSEDVTDHTEDDERALAELLASEDNDWQGYHEWSAALEADPVVNESENFTVTRNGRVYHKPEPKSLGRIGGVEI